MDYQQHLQNQINVDTSQVGNSKWLIWKLLMRMLNNQINFKSVSATDADGDTVLGTQKQVEQFYLLL